MPFRFLFDEQVSKPACDALRARGVDVTHVLDIGLARASDAEVLACASSEARIGGTRNYRDFAALVEAYRAGGKRLPGVLFLSVSLSQSDVGAHVGAMEEWIAGRGAEGESMENSIGWLSAP